MRHPVLIKHSQNHMATTFHFQVACERPSIPVAEETLRTAFHLVAILESELSEFREDSPVARLNQAAPLQRILFTPHAWTLFQRSEDLMRATDGAFDCLFRSRQALRESNHRLRADSKTRHVWKLVDGVHLGFGAIGKGYALDRVRELLEREGFHHYCLSAGGSSIIFSGFAGPETPWTWAWKWNSGRPLQFAHDSGIPVALGISGTLEQGAHVRDAKTGKVVPLHLQSTLVAHPSATDADALSTAAFVLGWEKSQEHFQDIPTPPALAVVDREDKISWNGTFHKLWGRTAACLMVLVGMPAWAEEAVDLSQMGQDDFTPYLIDRNRLWMLLPLAALALVFLHLKKAKVKKRTAQKPPWGELL